MINNVVLVGRITRELELRNAGTTPVLRFTLAVNRSFKREGQPEADFINCVAFGRTAEVISQYCSKGSQIGVEGQIQNGSYDKDGQTIYTTDIIVRQFHGLCSCFRRCNCVPLVATTNRGECWLDGSHQVPRKTHAKVTRKSDSPLGRGRAFYRNVQP